MMAASSPITRRLRHLVVTAGLAIPGLAVAHGSDHLHFWGSHTAEGQAMLLGGALLALAGIGWWLHSRD